MHDFYMECPSFPLNAGSVYTEACMWTGSHLSVYFLVIVHRKCHFLLPLFACRFAIFRQCSFYCDGWTSNDIATSLNLSTLSPWQNSESFNVTIYVRTYFCYCCWCCVVWLCACEDNKDPVPAIIILIYILWRDSAFVFLRSTKDCTWQFQTESD